MELQRLERRDVGLILVCAAIAAVSLYVGVRYFFRAFPEASIDFRVDKDASLPIAAAFAAQSGASTEGYRHASVFGFDDTAKVFLERELGVEESARMLDTTVRLWRWEHRWFQPLQKEEIQVAVTTRGEVVGFDHLLSEEAPGASLSQSEARAIAETFLTGAMQRPRDSLEFVLGDSEIKPHRTDHSFTWKLRGLDVHGAEYRFEVGIAGDIPVRYTEYLKVPDVWERDYAKLRSMNEAAGYVDTMLLLLTAVAMMIVLVRRLMGGTVRWHAAGILGAITAALQFLSALNMIPAQIYEYDTTTGFGAFVVKTLALALLSGLSFGAAIFLIAAAAEPLYRGRLGRFQSLDAILRPRALRTKEYFIASIVGLTMTCFFFAYENIFYIVATRFGAWSPRDVAYSDLLSTAFPWVYVLFIGWFPAISEEFISRMFSIPFFESLLRPARIAKLPIAMVVAAGIWGFGHATYPNQPWFIRGLEVGIAGIIFGLVFYRFGIISVVICHFSVDALYTAFALIRSPNPYYVATGVLTAGTFALVFLGTVVAYIVRGGFLPPGRTNAEEAHDDEVAAAALRSAAAGAAPPAPGAATTGTRYRPIGGRVAAIGLIAAGLLVALHFLPVAKFGDWVDVGATRAQAREAGAHFLKSAGFDVSTYRSAVIPFDRLDGTSAAYLLQNGGEGAVTRAYRDLVPTPVWRVRYFVPGQHEEFSVTVRTDTGEAIGFTRTLGDDAEGGSIESDTARDVAASFLRDHGTDTSSCEVKDSSQEDRKARRDHQLAWECPIEGAGEAKVRYEMTIQGSAVGAWTRGVKIPEAWQRQRESQSALTVALLLFKIPVIGLIAGLAILLLIARIRERRVPWLFAIIVGLVAGSAIAGLTILQFDQIWMNYPTSSAVGIFRILVVVSVVFAGILFALAGTIAAAVAGAAQPVAARLARADVRRLYARDALLAGLVACGIVEGRPALRAMIAALIPSGTMIEGVGFPTIIGASVPWLGLVFRLVFLAIFVASLGGIVAAVVARFIPKLPGRVVLVLVTIVAFLPSSAHLPAEFFQAGVSLAVTLGLVWAFCAYFLRDNPLAWLWSAWLGSGLALAQPLFGLSGAGYTLAGVVVLVLAVAPGLLLLRDAYQESRHNIVRVENGPS